MSHIRTFARIKPSNCLYEEYDVTPTTLQIRTPEVFRDYASPGKFRATVKHEFYFNNVFDISATQEQVFDGVAREIIDGFLTGFNGTIFAYGQTGTGKTYTVEGSARKYSDRGLAPRALSMIYKSLEKRSEDEITAHISYMEIYQEVAYDLLNPGARTFSPVTPLPKVSVIEGRGGACMLRNLSVHLAASEEVAQSLLLQGQTNRKVAETPVNQRSSRSHAVFTVYLAAKRPDSDVIVRSKLHLVDLAGSERVAKTGVDGQQLTEAKSINLSLHHLETVIVTLQDSSSENQLRQRSFHSLRQNNNTSPQQGRPWTSDETRSPKHVPYRNSLLTMVLRDSLGGNCQTAMIATISLEVQNIGESISTCRFAQRVACIANHAMRNEEIDDRTLIRRLKKKVAELEAEIAFMRLVKEGECTDEVMNSKLTDEDKLHCAQVVHEYLGGRLTDPVTAGITDPYKFRECLRLLKKMVLSGYFNSHSGSGSGSGFASSKSLGKSDQNNGCVTYMENSSKSVQILQINHEEGDVIHGADENVNNNTSTDWDSVPPVKPQPAWGERTFLQPTTPEYNKAKSPGGPSTPQRSTQSPSVSKYKSPYERKREREIHRLSRRVNTLQNSFDSKESKLLELKHSVQMQELDIMESGFRAKLSVTQDQISHQQAYIAQLRDTEAEAELIEQEKLVERQLKKRQAKFEKKIDHIEQRKSQLLQVENETPELPKTPSKVGIEEKFGQYRKRDGSLNTKQVFDMLKTEEKKKQKAEAELEREKILTVSRQLEVREAATRQKLRELKQMIRQSHDPSEQTATFVEEEDKRSNGMKMFHNKQAFDPHPGRFFVTEENYLTKKDSKEHNNSSSRTKTSGNFDGKDIQEHEKAPRPASANIQDSNFYALRSSTTSVASRWDSAYSTRPSTADTRPNTADITANKQTAADGLSLHSLSQVFNSGDLQPVLECDNLQGNSVPSQKSRQSEVKNRHDEPIETVIPSEYVYGMAEGDTFDARRMGLSSQTFEAALSSMLDKEETVTYSKEYYNQFARSRKPKNGNPSHKQSPSRRVDKTNTDDAKLMMTWGPEAKTTSVSAKLNVFLQDLGDSSNTVSRPHGKPPSKSHSGDRFTSRLEEFQSSPVQNISNTKQKIKALSDAEREETYMTKAEAERHRIAKIRKARQAAEVIQKAWRKQRHQ